MERKTWNLAIELLSKVMADILRTNGQIVDLVCHNIGQTKFLQGFTARFYRMGKYKHTRIFRTFSIFNWQL